MRVYRDLNNDWGKRLWFAENEFAAATANLRRLAGPDSYNSGSGVDPELILERVYQLSPDFQHLQEGILGCTTFNPDGQIEVALSRDLADRAELCPIANRRLRSTLAHEIAHILFHSKLQTDYFNNTRADQAVSSPQILCRCPTETMIASRRRLPWWEYQANRGMVHLLLPETLVKHEADAVLSSVSLEGLRVFTTSLAHIVVDHVAKVFCTSRQMTWSRMRELGYALPRRSSRVERRR